MSGLIDMIFGGGGGSQKPAAPKPQASSVATGGAVAPGTSPSDYKRQQEAFFQQMLQGTGQTAGGGLPESLQSSIDRQASLISG